MIQYRKFYYPHNNYLHYKHIYHHSHSLFSLLLTIYSCLAHFPDTAKKTAMRYYYTPIRMTKTKLPRWKESEATKHLIHDCLGIQNGIVNSEDIFVLY